MASMHASVDGGESLCVCVCARRSHEKQYTPLARPRTPPSLNLRLRCGSALRYHQSTVASRSRRSTWKPQVSHNMWERSIAEKHGDIYFYSIFSTLVRVPKTPPRRIPVPDPIGYADP